MYQVSRSLIESRPDTRLVRLLSQARGHDGPIVVDRNGVVFEFALDYLRCGSIQLPRSNFIREMDFFGVSFDDASVIQDAFGADFFMLYKSKVVRLVRSRG